MALQPAAPAFTAQGALCSATQGALYHHGPDAPAAARHLFLAGNALPARWQGRQRFVVLEIGFGSGLNFLATWHAWRSDPQRCRRLHVVALETHPFSRDDLTRIQREWPAYAELAAQLQAAWPPLTPGMHRLHLAGGDLVLTLVFGDAATQVRTLDAAVDAFYLDGFSPAHTPALWTVHLFKGLARLAAPGATLAARYADDAICAALNEAEFAVALRPAPDGGPPMLAGHFRSRRPDRHPLPADRRALVLGAGIAGSTAAHRLAAAGWQVCVLDQAERPGAGASSNLAGMLRPLPSADDNRLSRLTRAGYLATRRLLQTLPNARWDGCGVLHLAREALHEAQQRRAVEKLGFPPALLQFVEREQAGALLGQPVPIGGWWFPEGGWVQPPSLCAAALAAFPSRIECRFGIEVAKIQHGSGGWQALDAAGGVIAEAPVLVMASGVNAPHFSQFEWLPQRAGRGQVTHLPASATPALNSVLFQIGYATPAIDGTCLIGASLSYGDHDPEDHLVDHRDNLARLRLTLPGFGNGIDPAALSGRVGFRPMSPDRLPMVGAVPLARPAGENGRLHALPRHPGLWCLQGYGARGIVWSALMADLLLSKLEGEPLPLENDLTDALDPGRFLIRPLDPSDNEDD